MLYDNGKPVKVTSVVILLNIQKLRSREGTRACYAIHKKVYTENYLDALDNKEVYINLWTIYWWTRRSTGLTGRKLS